MSSARRSCARRGLGQALVAVGGGALGCIVLGADVPPFTLVPYFVSWHVSAHGSHLAQTSRPVDNGVATETVYETYEADSTGSAVTRFRLYAGARQLLFGDTHYLTFTERENWDEWNTNTTPDHFCVNHLSHTIADPGTYAGFRAAVDGQPWDALLQNPPELTNGVYVMRQPLKVLMSELFGQLPIIDHNKLEGVAGNCAGMLSSNEGQRNAVGNFSSGDDPRLDLRATPQDPSAFFFHTRYSRVLDGSDIEVDVDWTAHAYLMGKCAEHDGPLQEGDPLITHEQVDIDAEDPEVTPDGDGKSNIKIRVTCDRIPVQNAEVEVKLEVEKNSGYHNHDDDNRPRGQLDGKEISKDSGLILKTDADGYAYAPSSKTKSVKFEPPPLKKATDHANYGDYLIGIAGTYKVTAKTTSKRIPSSSGTVVIKAGVKGLVPMDVSSTANYVLDRGGTAAHKYGSWGTRGTLEAFKNLAKNMAKYQHLHNVALQSCVTPRTQWPEPPVSINDIALPDGGLFDANSTWSPPKHQTHNRGEGGDFNRFGAAASPGINALGTGIECDGSTVKITGWLIHILLDLGSSYGHWDCSDLGISNCTNAELPALPWIPKNLHLHVED